LAFLIFEELTQTQILKMARDIADIEGIGPAYSEKLKAAGVDTVEQLLKMCCDKKGRKAMAEETGISEKSILTWVNHADLFRINGIGPQYGSWSGHR
jgi:predicted flap endonuclease-1-like 5' DNA nuclease